MIESVKRHGNSGPTRDIIIFAITLYTEMKIPSEVKRIGAQFTEEYERAMKLSWTSSSKYRNVHEFRGIHFASIHGDLDCLEILIAAGTSVLQPVYADSSEVFTPLILAVDAGQVPAVAFLKNGAHPNAQISDGRTALHFCSGQPDFKMACEMVALLVNASPSRAFIETKDQKRKTAKDIAKINQLESLVSFIMREVWAYLSSSSLTTKALEVCNTNTLTDTKGAIVRVHHFRTALYCGEIGLYRPSSLFGRGTRTHSNAYRFQKQSGNHCGIT